MARLHYLARVAVVAAGAAAAPAAAQTLPRLHVVALSQAADRAAVAPHETFHVTVRVLVRERRARLDELVLGDLENCTIVGDERLHSAVPGGTEFLERLTLEANAPGVAVVSPAHLDAVDPNSGRALRYSAGAPVRVRVNGPSALDAAAATLAGVLRVTLGIVAALAALAVVALIFVRRRPRAVAPAPPPVQTPPTPVAAAPDPLAAAFQAFRRRRDGESLAVLRAQLFAAAGVAHGATLADALARLDGQAPQLRAALAAADAATFAPAPDRDRAADELAALDERGVTAARTP